MDKFTKLILLVIAGCLVVLVVKGLTIMVKFEYPITLTQAYSEKTQQQERQEYDLSGLPKVK